MNSPSRRWLRQGRRAGRTAGAARHAWPTRQGRLPRHRSLDTGPSQLPPVLTDPGPEPEPGPAATSDELPERLARLDGDPSDSDGVTAPRTDAPSPSPSLP